MKVLQSSFTKTPCVQAWDGKRMFNSTALCGCHNSQSRIWTLKRTEEYYLVQRRVLLLKSRTLVHTWRNVSHVLDDKCSWRHKIDDSNETIKQQMVAVIITAVLKWLTQGIRKQTRRHNQDRHSCPKIEVDFPPGSMRSCSKALWHAVSSSSEIPQ